MGQLQAALPREHYVDPATWRRERDQVLARSWYCAGRLSELGLVAAGAVVPGRLAVVDVLGESVLVTTAKDGRIHAHYNVCRHRGSQVVAVDPAVGPPAPCKLWALRCGYHSWTYDLDGSLRYAPHTDDVDFDPVAFGLHPVGVEAWGGFLWLNLTPERAASLADELGAVPERIVRYPLDSLVVGATLTYDVDANWKVIAENYNECYHCGPVHPELVQLVPAFAQDGGSNLDWEGGVPHRDGAWTFTASGTSDRDRFPDLDADERERHKGELVYPNLMLSLSADHVAAFRLEPVATDRTRVICELLFAPSEVAKPTFDPSDAAEFWDVVNLQDWTVCASVQRGMSSRAYLNGWYAPMEDASLDIRRWLLPRLEKRSTHG